MLSGCLVVVHLSHLNSEIFTLEKDKQAKQHTPLAYYPYHLRYIKPELRFSTGSNRVHDVSEVFNGEKLRQFLLKIRLNVFRRSIILQNNSSWI